MLDRSKLSSPPAKTRLVLADAGGFDLPRPTYHPAVAAHDLPPTRDARQSARAPYASVVGPGRSVLPPQQQLQLAHAAKLDTKPKTQTRIAAYLNQNPDPKSRLQEIDRVARTTGVSEAGILPAIDALSHLSKPDEVLKDWPNTGRQLAPATRQALLDRAATQGNVLSGDPTDAQLLKGALETHRSKDWTNLSEIATNMPRSAALTFLHTMQGGAALGSQAIGHGDWGGAARNFLAAQKQFATDLITKPLATAESDPFGTLLAVSAGAKAAGALEGRARGLQIEDRIVPATEHANPVTGKTLSIDRGTLSPNAHIRRVQKLQDALTTHGPLKERLQASGLARNIREQEGLARVEQQHAFSELANPVIKADRALKKGKKGDASRVLANEAQGLSPAEVEAFNAQRIGSDAPLTPEEQHYLEANRAAEAGGADILQRLNVLSDYSRYSRNYKNAALAQAQSGSRTARAWLDADHALRSTDTPTPELRTAAEQSLARFAAEHGGTLPDASAPSPIGNLPSDAHFDYTTSAMPHHFPSGDPMPTSTGTGTDYIVHAEAKTPRPLPDAPGQRNMVQTQGGQTILNVDDEAKNIHVEKIDVREVYRDTPLALTLLQHAVGEAEKRGYSITADFENPRLNQIADKVFARRGYVRDTSGKTTIYRPPARPPQAMPFPPPPAANAPLRVDLPKLDNPEAALGQSGGAGAKLQGEVTHAYGAKRFQSGDYAPPTTKTVLADLKGRARAAGTIDLLRRVEDPKNGLSLEVVPLQDVPEGFTLYKVHGEGITTERPGDAVLKNVMHGTRQVPRDAENYRLVPTTVVRQLEQQARDANRDSLWRQRSLQLGKIQRNVQLYSRLSYPLTNTGDNALRGSLFAGVGPASYWRAAHPDDWKVPPGIGGHGTAATHLDELDRSNPLSAYTRGVRHLAVGGEDLTRRSIYLKSAVPAAKRFGDPQQVLARWAQGEFHSDAERLASKAAGEQANRILGDFAAMGSNPLLDALAPYNRWPRFVVGNTLKTLPLHHPAQLLALAQMGKYGQQAQNQLGLLSPGSQGLAPLAGDPTHALTAQTSYPLAFATLGSMLAPTGVGGSLSGRGVASYISPYIRVPLGLLTGQDPVTGHAFKSQTGASVNGLSSLRLDVAQILNQVPPLRALFQRGAHPADTSIPLPGLTQEKLRSGTGGFQAQRYPTPLWMSLLNTVQPFRLGYTDLQGQSLQDLLALKAALLADLRRQARARALTGSGR